MSAGFTPGPWHYGDEDESLIGVHYVDVHAGEYCTPSYRCAASVEGPFVEGEFGPLDDETRANACLIAAAPELYDDAEFLCARVRELEQALTDDSEAAREFFGHVIPALARMEASIAKARGEQ